MVGLKSGHIRKTLTQNGEPQRLKLGDRGGGGGGAEEEEEDSNGTIGSKVSHWCLMPHQSLWPPQGEVLGQPSAMSDGDDGSDEMMLVVSFSACHC